MKYFFLQTILPGRAVLQMFTFSLLVTSPIISENNSVELTEVTGCVIIILLFNIAEHKYTQR